MSLSVSRPSLSWLPRSLCCVGRTRFLQFYLQVLVSSSGLPPTLNCASCENCCANIQCFVTQVREVTAAAAPVQSKSSRRTEETAGRYLRCETVHSPQVCTLTTHRQDTADSLGFHLIPDGLHNFTIRSGAKCKMWYFWSSCRARGQVGDSRALAGVITGQQSIPSDTIRCLRCRGGSFLTATNCSLLHFNIYIDVWLWIIHPVSHSLKKCSKRWPHKMTKVDHIKFCTLWWS